MNKFIIPKNIKEEIGGNVFAFARFMGGWATGACDCSWTSTESYFKIMYQVNDKDEIFFGFIRVSTEKNNDSFSEKWTFQKKQFDSLICQNNGEKLRFAPYVE